MKKALALILIITCLAAFCSCKKSAGTEGETSAKAEITSSQSGEEITSAESGETEKENTNKSGSDNEKEDASEGETTEAPKVMSMDVYSESSTFRIVESEKVAEIYNYLNSLEYEKTEDKKLDDGIGVYFQDENGVEVKSFYIKGKYLRVDGLPETYKITSKDYDFESLSEKIKGAGNEEFEKWE